MKEVLKSCQYFKIDKQNKLAELTMKKFYNLGARSGPAYLGLFSIWKLFAKVISRRQVTTSGERVK